jgi:hypothetical protein
MKLTLKALVVGATLMLVQPVTAEAAMQSIVLPPGIVIRAEDRFDPAIQRLMADHSLRLLPLERGQLYYLYPIGVTPRLEGVQIQYLEHLLDKQAAENDQSDKPSDAEEE